jgi:hypothetical protein
MYPAVRGRTLNSSIVLQIVGVSNFAKAAKSTAMQRRLYRVELNNER